MNPELSKTEPALEEKQLTRAARRRKAKQEQKRNDWIESGFLNEKTGKTKAKEIRAHSQHARSKYRPHQGKKEKAKYAKMAPETTSPEA